MAQSQEKYYEENRGKDLRRNPEGYRRWVVSEMWDVHHEIARRVVLGQKNVAIAEALNLSPQMVCNVKNSPIVQDHIAIMKGARDAETIDLAEEIKEVAPNALSLLRDVIDGDIEAPPVVRVNAAKDIMDRAGYGAPKKLFMESISTHLTADDIINIKQRALEAGVLKEVPDAEVVLDTKEE